MATPYTKGAELPDLAITWLDHTGEVIDFSTGWTFAIKVGTPGKPAEFTKDTGITGDDTAPNLVIAWATTGELDSLAPNKAYTLAITAKRTTDDKERKMNTTIYIGDTVEDEGP